MAFPNSQAEAALCRPHDNEQWPSLSRPPHSTTTALPPRTIDRSIRLSGLQIQPGMAIRQTDLPLDRYQEEFKPCAEEYLALPWMDRYPKPALAEFGPRLRLHRPVHGLPAVRLQPAERAAGLGLQQCAGGRPPLRNRKPQPITLPASRRASAHHAAARRAARPRGRRPHAPARAARPERPGSRRFPPRP